MRCTCWSSNYVSKTAVIAVESFAEPTDYQDSQISLQPGVAPNRISEALLWARGFHVMTCRQMLRERTSSQSASMLCTKHLHPFGKSNIDIACCRWIN